MYAAPVKEILFVMKHLANIEGILSYPQFQEAGVDLETAEAILEEAAKLNQEVIAPINWPGDQTPSRLNDGIVTTSPGFKDAYQQYIAGGWQGVIHPQEYGGQGLPRVISTACQEMVNSASLSFALCPLLTDGAIEALLTAASDEVKEKYLPKMISGQWTGTMNLTEPQAGSDLALVRSKALPQADGTYKVFGTKIYITYGEHDFTENIIHLVLARTPDAPEGVKGISLFVVPKFLVSDSGELKERNDVHCVSIEHKLGIKASPTAVLQFGDQGGAIGYLVGQENRGLEYMFVMMNAARFAVGMQGIAISERAYQQALTYAKDRVQGKDLEGSAQAVSIIHHPDVKKMLMTMRTQIEGARSLAYVAASHCDLSELSQDEKERQMHHGIYEFLVPIVKGYSTEMGVELASLGVQVHGGMGFIEETGAAQHYRDARILPIYEGTTAIQANDLIGRKTLKDGGRVAKVLAQMILDTEKELSQLNTEVAKVMQRRLKEAREGFEAVVEYILTNTKGHIKDVFAGSTTYLKLCGITLSGWQMARAILAIEKIKAEDEGFAQAKIATAHFFAAHLLVMVPALANAILEGGQATNALNIEHF